MNPAGLLSLPILSAGLCLIAVCVLVPQAEANKRLAVDRDQLRLDVAHADAQLDVNARFLSAAATDPEVVERLAQRQMRQIRQGATALHLDGDAAGAPPVTTVADMLRVPTPPPVPAYRPPEGLVGDLTNTTRHQLLGLGGGLLLVAAGLVLGTSEAPAKSESEDTLEDPGLDEPSAALVYHSHTAMHICLYTGSALPKLGGQEAVVDALARHLQRLGHDPTVLAPRPRLPLRPRDGDLPYRVIRHPRFYSTHHLVSWYRTFLLRAHRRRPFDIIHCHDAYPTGYVAALCKPTTGVPLVITSHGGDVRAGNARLRKPGLRPRFLRAVAAADALVCIGRFTREAFLQLGATEAQLVDIPNGVDPDPVSVAVRPADLDPAIVPGRYLLFLGRLAHRKGVDTLLNALSLLPPTGGVELVIAGSGDLQSAIEQDVRERQLTDRVRLVGRVGGADKSYLLHNAIAVVMPSRGWEAFPLVVLEAYVAGRPVVASAVAGLEDLVTPDTGLLVPPDAPTEWATALAKVRDDAAWRDRAGHAASAAAAGYEWDVIARRHVALYDRLRAEIG